VPADGIGTEEKLGKNEEEEKTYTTQAKLGHDTTTATRQSTPVLDGPRTGVFSESIQLELSLIANLGGEGLIAGHRQICTTSDFVLEHALPRLHVAQDACFDMHSGGEGDGKWRERSFKNLNIKHSTLFASTQQPN